MKPHKYKAILRRKYQPNLKQPWGQITWKKKKEHKKKKGWTNLKL